MLNLHFITSKITASFRFAFKMFACGEWSLVGFVQGRTMGKKQQSPGPDYWLTLGVIRNGMTDF